jgi:predicted O-methyltransferase YrrM
VTYPNWFASYAIAYFDKHLTKFKNKEDLRFLQVGAFTGDASLWLMQNILTEKSSVLVDVDTWQGSDEEAHHKMDFLDVEKTYDWKLKDYPRVIKVKSTSLEFYARLPKEELYDFIYIDGDHTAQGVWHDASLGWKALKRGGVMAFDDYLWGSELPFEKRPQPAIDLFLTLLKEQIELLDTGSQIWIRKR